MNVYSMGAKKQILIVECFAPYAVALEYLHYHSSILTGATKK